ncbi:hypothetical protein KSP40_PGU003654 [Platanthera guangdongensis]|uniref:Uncharacterized protein n=1 Tax=Platanthera guangdongensis TaxID=2320717 RepID=A0ABR2MW21_9ASPA
MGAPSTSSSKRRLTRCRWRLRGCWPRTGPCSGSREKGSRGRRWPPCHPGGAVPKLQVRHCGRPQQLQRDLREAPDQRLPLSPLVFPSVLEVQRRGGAGQG